MLTERQLVSHLLRRAGFGSYGDEPERFHQAGFDATLKWLLDGERPEAPAVGELAGRYDLQSTEGLKSWWLHRMLVTRQPLREKMTFFWHGHFATASRRVDNPAWMLRQNELLRAHALGNFGELVQAVTHDAAMMRWLDVLGSHKRAPNENYARELMELFTLGRGAYTELDIKEAARALSGWRLRDDVPTFDPDRHDGGVKTLLGAPGRWRSEDVASIVVQQPACARLIARKLFTFFIYDDPELAVVDRFAAIFQASGLSIRALVEALLRSPEFRSERAFHAKIKSPVEFAIGALRDLGLRTVPAWLNLAAATRAMGQDILDPPSVKGWDGGRTWLSSGWFIARCNFVAALLNGHEADGRRWVDATRLATHLAVGWDTHSIVLRCAERALDGDVPRNLVELIADAVGELSAMADRAQRDLRLRIALHLLLTSPVYQFS